MTHPCLENVCPPVTQLHIKGDASLLSSKSFGIVGTRRPSAVGMRAALTFSKTLAGRGFTIVSGLARGIDSMAHRGALQAGGKTIAVLGHGLDKIYPPENRGLAEEILEKGGALVSEYPENTPALAFHFPARNRIIAALSNELVIIEAGEKSGSLITARYALEFGKEIHIVPGPFDENSFLGGHRLVQQGASLALTPWDLLEASASEDQPTLFPVLSEPLAQLQCLFKKLGKEATLQQLFTQSSWMLPELMERLKRAEEQGLVEEVGTQKYIWLE